MMKGIIIGVSAVAVIAAALIIVGGVNGLFYKPVAAERVMGPYNYAFEDFTGPYAKTFPVFQRVYDILTKNGIENTVGIGLYHDDPAKVPADKLRSSCGSVIKESDIVKAEQLGLKTGFIPQKNCVIIEFPVNSGLAYMFAPSKCYPVLAKYVTEKGYPLSAPFEIYDVPNKKMYVVMGL